MLLNKSRGKRIFRERERGHSVFVRANSSELTKIEVKAFSEPSSKGVNLQGLLFPGSVKYVNKVFNIGV